METGKQKTIIFNSLSKRGNYSAPQPTIYIRQLLLNDGAKILLFFDSL